MRGALEMGNGKFKNNSGQVINVRYSIWQKPATDPHQTSDWGGIITTPTQDFLLDVEQGTIEMEDERKGNIIISEIIKNMGTFVGNGPFPTKK